MWNIIFFQDFQTLILATKKRDEKKEKREMKKGKKKKEEPNLLSHSSSWAQQLNISFTFVLIEKLVIWF